LKKCIYLLECSTWKLIPLEVQSQIDTVFTGHYGCQKAAHYSMQQAQELKNEYGLNLHYISPKTSNDAIKLEEEYIIKLLEYGIKVSINDWGLLYRLKTHGVSSDFIYLGRLLSKSIADWVWSDIFFQKEKRNAVDYLSQNNLNDTEKIEWLKSFHIAGVEVTIHRNSEKSYEEIQKNGLQVIGYVDNEIVALSRACLFKKLDDQSNAVCSGQCHNGIKAIKNEGQQLTLNVAGNLLTKYNKKTTQWAGYDALVYDWQTINE
jgi:hypothetical protein